MVFARVANFFTTADPGSNSLVDDGARGGGGFKMEGKLPKFGGAKDTPITHPVEQEVGVDEEPARPPYIHVRRIRVNEVLGGRTND